MSRPALTAMVGVIGIGLLARKHGSLAIPVQQESENPRGKIRFKMEIKVVFENPNERAWTMSLGSPLIMTHPQLMIEDNELLATKSADSKYTPWSKAQLQEHNKLIIHDWLQHNLDTMLDGLGIARITSATTTLKEFEMGVMVTWIADDTGNPGEKLDEIIKTIKESGRFRRKTIGRIPDPQAPPWMQDSWVLNLNPEITSLKVSSQDPQPLAGLDWERRTIKEKQPRPRRR